MRSSKVVKGALRTNMDVKAFALKDMVAEAEALAKEDMKAKEEEAARVLAEEKARQAIYEKGAAKGFEEGYQKGLLEGSARGFEEGEVAGKAIKESELSEYNSALSEYNKVVSLLLPLASGLTDLTEKIATTAEKDVLTISMAVAERIVQKEISENQEVILGFVTEGLKNLGPAETAIIRIHPADFELLSKKSQALLQAMEVAPLAGGVQCIKFEQDMSLLPGDVIVESKERSVDARPHSQLAIIERRLLPNAEEGNIPVKEKK